MFGIGASERLIQSQRELIAELRRTIDLLEKRIEFFSVKQKYIVDMDGPVEMKVANQWDGLDKLKEPIIPPFPPDRILPESGKPRKSTIIPDVPADKLDTFENVVKQDPPRLNRD